MAATNAPASSIQSTILPSLSAGLELSPDSSLIFGSSFTSAPLMLTPPWVEVDAEAAFSRAAVVASCSEIVDVEIVFAPSAATVL